MTLSSTTKRSQYTGNGSTDTFNTGFYFLADEHIAVYQLVDLTGVESLLTLNVDYTVTGAGNPAGGAVVLGTPPATDDKLTIVRSVPLTQLVDYIENDSFPANTHEQALDQLTMALQMLEEHIDRAVIAAVSSSVTVTLPSPQAGKALKWNTGADDLENSTYDPDTAQTDAAAAAAAAAASAADSDTAKTAAEAAQALAEDWAEEVPDTLVEAGSEVVTNGGFDSAATGWTALNSASLASVAGGQSGNCLEITEDGADDPGAYQDLTTDVGEVYELTLYAKEGTEATFRVFTSETDGSSQQLLEGMQDQEATSGWVAHRMFFKAPAATTRLTLQQVASSGAGTTMLFDTVSVKANKYSSKHWAFQKIQGITAIHFSTEDPTAGDGQDGDVWFKYA
jgi:hypothetical protein